jgi:NTE family protein
MKAARDPEPNLMNQSGADLRTRRNTPGDEGAGIALALGGGFSRGFAHLGVLEVLEQEQVPISAIVGTSIGGLLGAAYADGISVRQLCELGRQIRFRDFIRFHKSKLETQPNDLIGRFVREWFHAARIEELLLPTAIVTTDLDTRGPHVFTQGPIEIAIRATCAFPGLFRPVVHEGKRLADGCIVAPVPTAIAAQMNRACVLGVAVGSRARIALSPGNVVQMRDLEDSASPGQGARALHVFPEISGTARRNLAVPAWIRLADILLEPDVHHINWNDFSRVDEAHDAGVLAMRRALPYVREWLARRRRMRPREQACSGPQSRLAI